MGLYPKDAVYVAQQEAAENDTYRLACVKTLMAAAAVFPTAINGALKKKLTGLTGPVRQASITLNEIFPFFTELGP